MQAALKDARLAPLGAALKEAGLAPLGAKYRLTAENIPRYTKLLDTLVQMDAAHWAMNRYVHGSMRNVEIKKSDMDGPTGDAILQGTYTYNQTQTGWTKIKFNLNRTPCIEFHDFAGTCREIRLPGPDKARP